MPFFPPSGGIELPTSLPSLPSLSGLTSSLASAVGSLTGALPGALSGASGTQAASSAPDSQKAGERPISFLLDDQSLGVAEPTPFLDLVIRPEELTRTDPSRINVQQTLGGAWADSFGAGLPQITISGHTGWRRRPSSDQDGVDRFLELKDQVFDQWHQRRDAATLRGTDPNNVRLVFSDALDDFTVVVAPMSFVLRRSKSRPLLCQYQIVMVVIDGDPGIEREDDAVMDSAADPAMLQGLGLTSLTASVASITAQIGNVQKMVNGSLVAPVQAFMGQTAQLYGQVRAAITAGSQLAGSLISVAQMTAQAGVNIFRSIAAVASIPQIAKAQLMSVASAYSNISCVLNNALHQQIYFQDYSAVYGASNCSSTSGGRPISSLAGVNPFYSAVPTPIALPINLTQDAQTAFRTFASADNVLAPISPAALTSGLSSIASGFSISV
jgi:hypothetical protein